MNNLDLNTSILEKKYNEIEKFRKERNRKIHNEMVEFLESIKKSKVE